MGPVVIIGAGECGVRAAFALRTAGYDGVIRLVGEETHLPYERPPLSKGHPVRPKVISQEAAFADASIDLMLGRRVEAIDRSASAVRLTDGKDLAYGKLLIATGARPRLFAGMGAAKTLRTLDHAADIFDRLRPASRLVIIGGGFIGLELAAVARGLGVDVTVLEAADRLMARVVPAGVAAVAEERHRREGVEIVFDAQAAAVEAGGVRLTDGRNFACDLAVAGIGAVANTALAETAGLPVENGIVVDEGFRTVDPAIYAAGDCCAFPYRGRLVRLESWRAAQDQGNHVALAMLGHEDPYGKIPWFWSDQYDLMLQIAGLPDGSGRPVRRELASGGFIVFEMDAGGRLVSASGIGRGNAVARDIRLAEMLIERQVPVAPEQLADPSFNLKALVKGRRA